MPRVSKSTRAASARSPRAQIAAPRPRLADRPGRWKLLLRRRGRLLRLLAGLAVAGVAGLMLIGTVRGLAQRINPTEWIGSATAGLGLKVAHVEFIGQKKTPVALLRAALGVSAGDPILTISLAAARKRIESIDWVRSATVERHLPDTIVVRITERRPVAVWQNDGKFALIDEAGKPVTDSQVATFFNRLPLVVGDGANRAAGRLIDALDAHPKLMERVVAAVRVGDRRWNLHLKSGIDVLLPEGAAPEAIDKLVELERRDQLLDRPLARIDMRLPDRMVLRLRASEPEARTKEGKKT